MHRTLSTYSKNGKMHAIITNGLEFFFPKSIDILSFDAKNLCVSSQIAFFTVFRALCAFTPGGQVAHMEMWK